MSRGLIFEVRECCFHDGDGVRTTVFFKGCPLRCVWCQNPEGQALKPEMLFHEKRCIHCGACAKVCPKGVKMKPCDSCGLCVKVCPEGARQICGKWMTDEELAAKLNRSADFLLKNGGVTFSGGEPLMQADFLADVIERIRPLSVEIETCGFAPSEAYRKIVGMVDHVFQDMKIMSPADHKRYAGTDNGLILSNIAWLMTEASTPFTIRVPMIPGITDTEDNLRAIAEFVAAHPSKNMTEVQLLPYNFAAGAKYPLLGKEYCPPFDPSAKCVANAAPFRELGIPCRLM